VIKLFDKAFGLCFVLYVSLFFVLQGKGGHKKRIEGMATIEVSSIRVI
jgi:hypothetical protein